jgi:hypothetical protein
MMTTWSSNHTAMHGFPRAEPSPRLSLRSGTAYGRTVDVGLAPPLPASAPFLCLSVCLSVCPSVARKGFQIMALIGNPLQRGRRRQHASRLTGLAVCVLSVRVRHSLTYLPPTLVSVCLRTDCNTLHFFCSPRATRPPPPPPRARARNRRRPRADSATGGSLMPGTSEGGVGPPSSFEPRHDRNNEDGAPAIITRAAVLATPGRFPRLWVGPFLHHTATHPPPPYELHDLPSSSSSSVLRSTFFPVAPPCGRRRPESGSTPGQWPALAATAAPLPQPS